MKSKLPRNTISKLEDQKDENDEWTIETFRKRLKRYITVQEAGDQQLRLYQRNENIFRSNANSPSLSDLPMRCTGETLMSNELRVPHKNSKCIFCDGKHWSDECRSFPDVLSRKRRLKKRRFICLKEGHLAIECKLQNKVCVHCGEKKKHHRSLCPEKFEITKTPGIERNENDKNMTPHEHNLVAVGEKIVMQTALATVKNPETLRCEKTSILMDTGSQRTYITKELADNLRLKTREAQEYSVYTFGNKKPKKIATSLVEITIKTQKGDDILIKASIVPQITGLVQRIV